MTTQPAAPDVVVVMNDHDANKLHNFPSNHIKTAKYTLLTFLPLNLFQQFRRISNFYFAVNMIFALIPGVSPINPATAVLPLIFVVGVALVKDAAEEYQRHQADARANSIKTNVVRKGEDGAYALTEVESKDVQVGDIIRIQLGDEVRADVVMLSSSVAECQAFIDTCNLDGETNLKNRKAIEQTWGLNSLENIVHHRVVIRTGQPDPGLLFWTGTLTLDDEEYAVGLDQFLYRSCVLRNTDEVWGVVVYAGVDTKMFRNLEEKPPKMSNLDQNLNWLILCVLIVQVSLLITLASVAVAWNADAQTHWYIRYYAREQTGFILWIYRFLSYFILLSYLIPISLFVTIELCKVAQARFMLWDEHMFEFMHGKWYGCIPNTSNLNEQLSQVRFIFTDKTGTLTENVMNYKKGNALGVPIDSDDLESTKRGLQEGGAKQKALEDYFLALSLCHTIQPFEDPHNAGEKLYEGASPDEVALVKIAADHGFVLMGRSTRNIIIHVNGKELNYEILATLEFTPDRKMMSMIVKSPTGAITIFTKGADSFVMPQMSNGPENSSKLPETREALGDMAALGLRTLLVCQKSISEAEFQAWYARFIDAGKKLVNRSQEVDRVCLEMEKNLLLVGATAIEDKLQDQVPETLRFFLGAGVVVWMLTGDKRETAVTIAATSSLCDPQADHVDHIDIGDNDMTSQTAKDLVRTAIDTITQHLDEGEKQVCFVVDGPALNIALADYRKDFIEISKRVKSAVCCRLTPLQKANVVKMFQTETGSTALAIGDGANDVSMIQEGRVGVGIVGLEGAQAALAADYAIPRFKHLRRLCAVHGRYALVRNAICTCMSFYKNALMSLTQFYFAFHSFCSAMTLYDGWLLTFYNIFFTFLPPLAMGILEKDVHEEILVDDNHASLYRPLSEGQYFSPRVLAVWFIQAIIHSLILYWVSFPTNQLLDQEEYSTDGLMYGTILMTCMVLLALGKFLVHLKYWTWPTFLSIFLSAVIYFGFILVYAAIPSVLGDTSFYYTVYILMSGPKFWFYILLFVLGILFPVDIATYYFQKKWFPHDCDLAEEEYYAMKEQAQN